MGVHYSQYFDTGGYFEEIFNVNQTKFKPNEIQIYANSYKIRH